MLSTLLTAALILVTPTEDMTLRAGSSGGAGTRFEFASTPKKEDGPTPKYTITNTLSNFRERPYRYDFEHGQTAWIAATTRKGDATIPKSVTAVRTSYREFTQHIGSITWAKTNGEEEGAGTAGQWVESNATPVRVHPGAKLEAKLIDGGPTGKVLVRCVSEVTGDKDKGYAYTLTIENLSSDAVSFKWAGLRGRIEPKKTLTKSESATILTTEQSGVATLDFGNKREFGIRANFWDRPK